MADAAQPAASPGEAAAAASTHPSESGTGNSSGSSDRPALDECEQLVLEACALENAAIQLDRSGDLKEAICKYGECIAKLASAIEIALPEHQSDHPKLIEHQKEVSTRIDYLKSLDGKAPDVPVTEHIHAVQLKMCGEKGGSKSEGLHTAQNAAMVVAAGVVGAAIVSAGGFMVLGSTLAVAASSTAMSASAAAGAAGAAGASYAIKHHPDEVDSVKDKLGQKVTEAGAVAADTAARVAPIAKQVTKDLHGRMTEAGAAAADTAARVAPNSTATAKVLADQAKERASFIGSKLAVVGAQAAQRAGDMIEKGAERSGKQGKSKFGFGSLVSRAQNITSSFTNTSSAPAAQAEEVLSEPTHDLRIEVLALKELGEPEYRVGDVASSLLKGSPAASLASSFATAKLSAVYVELSLGSRKVSTDTAKSSSDSGRPSVTYSSERHLFAYRGENQLCIAARDQRKMQGLVRGDPLIGEGILTLDINDLSDLQPRAADVPLNLQGEPAGKVFLRYQLVPLLASGSGYAADVPGAAVAQEANALSSSTAASPSVTSDSVPAAASTPTAGSAPATEGAPVSAAVSEPSSSAAPAAPIKPAAAVEQDASSAPVVAAVSAQDLDFMTPPSSPR